MTGAVTRFAPSPTGLMHLGHAHAALFAQRAAGDGRFLLRIEDIDRARCRAEFETAILEDLAWIGLDWVSPVMRQSDQTAAYRVALGQLEDLGILYPCFCTRKEITAEIARAATAPHGPDGPLYPGTCRHLSAEERDELIARGDDFALRLDTANAASHVGKPTFHDRGRGSISVQPHLFGDVIVARKDIGTSYHLSVVVDDAAQAITLVTRGEDLLPSTHIHRLLQILLELPEPEYHHHGLIRDDGGVRLAKRADARSLRALREAGTSPAEARALAGFPD